MRRDDILHPPRRLEKSDRRDGFHCGEVSLDDWFHRYALQNQRAHNCVVYVAMWNEEPLGYYALCTGGVERELVPEDFAKGRPRVVPVIILARLAVDERAQGRGLGRDLLKDALARSFAASVEIGAAAIVVHAKDEEAKQFYLRHADFKPLPGEPLHLMLPTKMIGQMLAD